MSNALRSSCVARATSAALRVPRRPSARVPRTDEHPQQHGAAVRPLHAGLPSLVARFLPGTAPVPGSLDALRQPPDSPSACSRCSSDCFRSASPLRLSSSATSHDSSTRWMAWSASLGIEVDLLSSVMGAASRAARLADVASIRARANGDVHGDRLSRFCPQYPSAFAVVSRNTASCANGRSWPAVIVTVTPN